MSNISAQNLRSVRLNDPVLTQLAQGYNNAELVGETLMPTVEVPKEGGIIPIFGRLAFRQHSTVREVFGKSNRLTPEGVTTKTVELVEHDAEYPIDYREEFEANYPLKQYALSVVQDVIALGREVEIATIAQDKEKYLPENTTALSADEKFSNLKSNPLPIFDKALRAVSSTIGRKPNVCVISDNVWDKLKENEILLERIKYTQTGILTPEVFAKLIGVEVVKIGSAMQEVDGELVKIWKNTVILAYVAKDKSSIFNPCYGYTVRRNKGLFVDTYYEHGGKVMVIRATDIHKPYLLGRSAGYLFTECL